MYRKVAAVWVSLLIMVSSIVILVEIAPPVKGNIIYVGGSNPGNFSTIQEGINAANPGNTVYVYNGTYYENVEVNKTITLIGENRETTIINGSGVGNVITITANGVSVTQFNISGGGPDSFDGGIYVSSVINCKIYNNIVMSNIQNGIQIFSSDGNNIYDNKIYLNGNYGIYLRISDDNFISNNNVTMNDIGIFLWFTSRINVADNNIMSNSRTGIILGTFCYDINILRNNISNHRQGIDMNADGGNIAYNNISNNDFGIRLYSRWINVIENIMVNNGIFLTGHIVEFWNTNYIDSTNTVNGKPVCYVKNQTGGSIPPGYGQVILANCSNVDVENQNLPNGTVGIELGFSSYNNIINNNVSNSYYGIYLENSDKNNILSNKIQFSDQEGIYVKLSDENKISDNQVSNNIYAISVQYSYGNNIFTNDIWDNIWGVYSDSSDESRFADTNFLNNSYSVWMYNSDRNNISNNKGLKGTNHISISTSDGNNITNNNLDGGSIILFSSHWNNITKNNVNKSNGIYLQGSRWNNITRNNASDNDQGIFLVGSDWNNIMENYGVNNSDGIKLSFADENDFTKNNFTYCNNAGFYLESSDGNNITKNNASDCGYGIYLWVSNENTISENEVNSNIWYGFYVRTSSYNRIYHNNIINNSNQAYDDGSDNYWDDGYPSGGNYWSDYTGNDSYKGPNQDQPGSDGIGDTNYSIDLDSIDNYPFMDPYEYKPYELYLTLIPGWNLISIPMIQQNQNLIKVLEMIDGYYNAVQWYNSMESYDPWKHHKIGKPYGNDLFELNETMSFWVHITHPGNTIFLYNGTPPTSNQTIQLHPGWNMAGYPSLSNYNRSTGLNNLTFDTHVDAIQWYDAAVKTWHFMGPTDNFVPGRGYWVHSKLEVEWEVPL